MSVDVCQHGFFSHLQAEPSDAQLSVSASEHRILIKPSNMFVSVFTEEVCVQQPVPVHGLIPDKTEDDNTERENIRSM